MTYPTGFMMELAYPTAGAFETEAAEVAARLENTLGKAQDLLGVNFQHLGGEVWTARLFILLESVSVPEAVEIIQKLHGLVRSELRHHRLRQASLSRIDSDAEHLPSVPVLRTRHLFATSTPLDDYYDVAAYEACPGLHVERIGAFTLTTRALDAIAEEDFFAIAQEQAWHLARAAKPGVVKYGGPPRRLLELYQASTGRLELVGYNPLAALAEYTCWVEEDEHLAGWEIDALHRMAREGKTSTGLPLRITRVVFAERAQAEREKRPLLDGGIKVIYSRFGADHELTE
jgi:hypothetical protein